MLPGPDYVYRCPNCSALASQSSISSGNTFGAVYWSDAKREAPMLPERPALVACPSCKTYLWIESLELVGEVDWYHRDSSPAEWAKAPRFRSPDGNDFVRALNAGLGDTPEREQYIRIRLWWSLNDAYRKDDAPRGRRDRTFLDNLGRLGLLLDGSANDTLLRVEIERESSNFERAIQLCDKLLGMNVDRHLIEIATLICARAIAKDERVFRR